MLEEGNLAPSFTLKNQAGKSVSLKDFKGQWLVLYFYPKDDTPGCTREACGFRDDYLPLKKFGAALLGVSPDSSESHQKFTDKYSLPFPLLSDPEHKVSEKYGAWGEKTLYGRKFMGMIRSTFLIDPKGRIAKVWPRVKVDGHVKRVQEALAEHARPTAQRK
jgi:thioredoxin-dependent peroxiredoxin